LFIRGPQLQVRDYPRAGPYTKVKFHDGGWNELDVTVKGSIVTTTVNGKALTEKDVLELTVKDGKPQAKLNGQAMEVSSIALNSASPRLNKCNAESRKKPFKAGTKGDTGRHAKTGKFEFRRIRIKTLD